MSGEKTILFVCVQNSARSQMAEGFFKKYANKGITCVSAGTVPADKINPYAIEVMKEVGIDISANKPKILTNGMMDNATITINMGCMDKESCPALFISNPIDWSIPDPKGESIDKIRAIRDEIEKKVKELIADLETSK